MFSIIFFLYKNTSSTSTKILICVSCSGDAADVGYISDGWSSLSGKNEGSLPNTKGGLEVILHPTVQKG